MPKKMTHEEFMKQLIQRNNCVMVTEEFRNYSTPIHVKCFRCGYEFYTYPNKLLSGYGCPQDARSVPYAYKLIVEKQKQMNPDIIAVWTSANAKSCLQLYCKKCGHKWNRSLRSSIPPLFKNCPNCANTVK